LHHDRISNAVAGELKHTKLSCILNHFI